MEFWQVFLLINLLAAIFIVWPTIFVAKKYRQELRSDAQVDTNEEIYKDHLRDLEQTMIRGEIDEKEMAGLKKDLEQTLIEENTMIGIEQERPIISSFRSRIPVLTLVFALPILSLALYSALGAKDDWQIFQLANELAQLPPEQRGDSSQRLVAALQDRLKERPQNTQNWYLLATTAVSSAQYEEAVRAYREILKIEPEAPLVKAELAQALFLRAGNTITPEVRKNALEALEIAPNLATALGLAGIDAYQSGDYPKAIDYWQRALNQLDPNSAAAQALTGGIARAKVAVAETGGTSRDDPASGPSLTVKIAVDKNKVAVNENDAVFVYARAWQGPRMPLAIQRMTVADLPTKITLNKSMSMTQGMDLASFPQVELVARISTSGSAISQPGDWQASFGPVLVASQKEPIELTISEQILQETK